MLLVQDLDIPDEQSQCFRVRRDRTHEMIFKLRHDRGKRPARDAEGGETRDTLPQNRIEGVAMRAKIGATRGPCELAAEMGEPSAAG